MKPLSNVLPELVMEEILVKLPVKSLSRFKSVNKRWFSVTKTPRFVKDYFDRTIQNEDNQKLVIKAGDAFFTMLEGRLEEKAVTLDVSCIEMPIHSYVGMVIVGSGNGLLCLTNEGWPDPSICIWNPATRESYLLPFPNIERPEPFIPDDFTNTDSLGFGFGADISEYKVVRLVCEAGVARVSEDYAVEFVDRTSVELYSSRTNSWRQLDDLSFAMKDRYSRSYINGNPHWVGFTIDKLLIVSFDMVNEVFSEVPFPDGFILQNTTFAALRMFRGCLAIYFMNNESIGMHMWVMNNYPSKDSWVHIGTVNHDGFAYPIGYLRSGEALFHDCHGRLIAYSPEYDMSNFIENPELVPFDENEPSYYDVVPYMETLVAVGPTDNEVETQQAGIIESRRIGGSGE